ncbi:hypothetical protein H477_0171 [[Clostridium] sordellii ATCC 9714]|nr:hypothetical protein H477_0171 [[Clostridium] sordellii ATCC 9714] [Paeniclostridium sordellii ATCC 9714]
MAKNIKNVAEIIWRINMLNVQEYRHKIEEMSKNIEELRASL